MTNPLDAEDMDALADAIRKVKAFDTTPDDQMFAALPLVMAEFDRMRRKLDNITEGKTTMFLSDADRALPVQQLDDEALVKWVRPALAFFSQKIEEKSDDRPVVPLIAMHGVISMALCVLRAGATRGEYTTFGVTDRGEELGDWRVLIEKVEA